MSQRGDKLNHLMRPALAVSTGAPPTCFSSFVRADQAKESSLFKRGSLRGRGTKMARFSQSVTEAQYKIPTEHYRAS